VPGRMPRAVALELAAVDAMADECCPLQPTRTMSLTAVGGIELAAWSRKWVRTNSIAAARSSSASAGVRPCPLAPGTSGLCAQYQPSPPSSMIAVNSLDMGISYQKASGRRRLSGRKDTAYDTEIVDYH